MGGFVLSLLLSFILSFITAYAFYKAEHPLRGTVWFVMAMWLLFSTIISGLVGLFGILFKVLGVPYK